MGKKTKTIILPCLLLTLAFTLIRLPTTLSVFTDKKEYTIMIYPYNGRAETKLAFNDGSTIRQYETGQTITLNYTVYNTSAAEISSFDAVVTYPDGSTETQTLQNIASGGSKTTTFTKAASAPVLTPASGESRYREITVTGTPKGFKSLEDGTTHLVNVPSIESTVYVYK